MTTTEFIECILLVIIILEIVRSNDYFQYHGELDSIRAILPANLNVFTLFSQTIITFQTLFSFCFLTVIFREEMELCLLTMFWLFNVLILLIGYLFDKYPSLLPIMPSLFRWGKMRIGHVDGGETFYLLPKRSFSLKYLF